MSKQSGLGDNLYAGGYDLSGDTGSIGEAGGGPSLGEITGIDKSAYERIGLLRDGRINWQSWFNPDQAHPVLAALPRSDVQIMYCRGTQLGSPAAVVVAKQVGYDGTRGNEGSFTFALQGIANQYGLEWGRLLTAGKRTDTAATNGTGLDMIGAAGTNGLQAYLQVFDFTGTSVTVKLQQSSDNGAGDAWADLAGGGFTAATGITTERIAVTGAVERYLRVVTTGTFSNAVFAVMVAFNETAVTF